MLDLRTLAVGDEVHHPLLVLDVQQKGGDYPRTVLTFGNRTGRIDSSPYWAGRDEPIKGVTKGMVAQVVGVVAAYRDALQIEATSVRPLPKGSVELADLVPSVGSVDKYWQFLDDVRAKIAAPRLRAVVDLFYADDAFRRPQSLIQLALIKKRSSRLAVIAHIGIRAIVARSGRAR